MYVFIACIVLKLFCSKFIIYSFNPILMNNNFIYEYNILSLYEKYNYSIVHFTNTSFELLLLLLLFFYLNTI